MSEAGTQNGHALPATQQPYAIPEAIPRGKHGPIGPQRTRSAADSSSKSAHSAAGLANGAPGTPATPEGPHSQGAASSYQGYGGFSQDTYGVPRDYDFKSQDALSQSGDMYLTQNFPAYQTQVSPRPACQRNSILMYFLMTWIHGPGQWYFVDWLLWSFKSVIYSPQLMPDGCRYIALTCTGNAKMSQLILARSILELCICSS